MCIICLETKVVAETALAHDVEDEIFACDTI